MHRRFLALYLSSADISKYMYSPSKRPSPERWGENIHEMPILSLTMRWCDRGVLPPTPYNYTLFLSIISVQSMRLPTPFLTSSLSGFRNAREINAEAVRISP